MIIKSLLKEMRLHHYIKNLLIFLPLACSGQLFDLHKSAVTAYAFLAFCLMTSAIYFVNDLCDVKEDRQHPVKKKRPIANGDLSQRYAILFAVILAFASAMVAFLVLPKAALFLLLFYLIINLSYSFGLKHIPIIDITILSTGYFFRVLLGAIINHIEISNWLYIIVWSAAMYLGLSKRSAEINRVKTVSNRSKAVRYSPKLLEGYMNTCKTMFFFCYALWTFDPKNESLLQSVKYLKYTIPVIILLFLRYDMATEKAKSADPVDVLIHDWILLCMCVAYLSIMLLLFYVIK